jgi:hypothetical protein
MVLLVLGGRLGQGGRGDSNQNGSEKGCLHGRFSFVGSVHRNGRVLSARFSFQGWQGSGQTMLEIHPAASGF